MSLDIIETDKIKLTKQELAGSINSLTKRRSADKFSYLAGGDFSLPPYTTENFKARQEGADMSLQLAWRPKQVLDKKYLSVKYHAALSYPLQKEFAVLEREVDLSPGELMIISESSTPQGAKDTRPIWVVLSARFTEAGFAYDSLGGIGAKIQAKNGYPFISGLLDDSPAKSLGLKLGDVILAVDGYSTLQMTVDEASKLMRGNPGTEVRLKLKHLTSEQEEIVIKRKLIE